MPRRSNLQVILIAQKIDFSSLSLWFVVLQRLMSVAIGTKEGGRRAGRRDRVRRREKKEY